MSILFPSSVPSHFYPTFKNRKDPDTGLLLLLGGCVKSFLSWRVSTAENTHCNSTKLWLTANQLLQLHYSAELLLRFSVRKPFRGPKPCFITFSGFTCQTHLTCIFPYTSSPWESLRDADVGSRKMGPSLIRTVHWVHVKGTVFRTAMGHECPISFQQGISSNPCENACTVSHIYLRGLYGQNIQTSVGCVNSRLLSKASGWVLRSCLWLLRNPKIR